MFAVFAKNGVSDMRLKTILLYISLMIEISW